jgi:hypothetical protein
MSRSGVKCAAALAVIALAPAVKLRAADKDKIVYKWTRAR